ncbi:hypothetical protein HPB51_021680 [Rhipicephalus microplus]|uniref:THAP-type domain-containing protein n=1 Tax=Rhipicephalus microplus TaxID=6941 RepID=A0A9J6D762_RHIMP|nr:hypothetical protein HPB51_021680 [Rhipicephalus microplus]
MGKCFVPYCNTGYKSCKEKFSLFTPPHDQARLEAWRRAIPRKDRVLQRTHRVCEKHFAPHFILKMWSAKLNDHVLMSGNRRAGLSKDALPTIFEGAPSYLSKKMKTPRKQSRRLLAVQFALRAQAGPAAVPASGFKPSNKQQQPKIQMKSTKTAMSSRQVTPALQLLMKCSAQRQLCAFRRHRGVYIALTWKGIVTSCSTTPLCCAQVMGHVCFLTEKLCM